MCAVGGRICGAGTKRNNRVRRRLEALALEILETGVVKTFAQNLFAIVSIHQNISHLPENKTSSFGAAVAPHRRVHLESPSYQRPATPASAPLTGPRDDKSEEVFVCRLPGYSLLRS